MVFDVGLLCKVNKGEVSIINSINGNQVGNDANSTKIRKQLLEPVVAGTARELHERELTEQLREDSRRYSDAVWVGTGGGGRRVSEGNWGREESVDQAGDFRAEDGGFGETVG